MTEYEQLLFDCGRLFLFACILMVFLFLIFQAIDVVMFYIYKWKNGRFTKSGFFNGKDKKEDENKKEN
mgnify:CR=1 FL=1